MRWTKRLPAMVVVVLTGVVCFMAWSGVKTSIADALFILGTGFCFSHLLCASYSLGRRHERHVLLKQASEKHPSRAMKPKEITIVKKDEINALEEKHGEPIKGMESRSRLLASR